MDSVKSMRGGYIRIRITEENDVLVLSVYNTGMRMIKISSVDDENNIFLIVEDNGVGMQPEQVVQINKEMYEDIWVNRTTGFGIANVNRRIKLYYGEEYGLILESEPDIGTKVIVVVPKTRQAEKK